MFLPNNNFISCSSDKTIKIWEEIEKNIKYQNSTILTHANWIKLFYF
jgi:WD40 repeat protein